MARSRADPLSPYRKKRDFTQTCEPDGVERRAVPSRPAGALRYFVQRHEARRLHYDFRLELHGVLKSWAVPKGPSLDAATKRLAVHVEDHPLEYGRFEGRIPPGLYGAGQVMLWDDGIWTPLDDPEAAYAKGHLRFRLDGRRLRGDWMLIRTGREPDHWLLRKLDDPDAQPGHDAEADHAAGCPEHLPAGTPSSARFPDTLQPQLATLVDRAPTEPGWIYEIKLDGYRMLCRCDGDDIRFFTRNGVDFSHHLESVRNVLRRRVETDRLLWLDGEIVVFDEAGVSSFAALRDALANGPQRIVYVVFDLLHRGNRDLRPLPQEERTAALRAFFERLPATAADPIRYSDSVVATGADLWPLACERGLEGLIGKRLDARYVTGRSTAWIKLKCRPRQEVIVGGYTESASSRHGLGALLVGVRNGHDGIDYAGRIGTGFDAASARMLLARLTPLRRDRSPFTTTPPADHRGRIRWVRPDVVVDTQFAGWTSDRMLRQASYVGLRDDKPSTDVEREVPMKIETAADADRRTRKPANAERPAGVTITHPDRVVWSKPTTTKRDLARYYERIGDAMMPHLVDRPLSLLRCPDGTDSGCFFQKHLSHALPTGVRRFSPDGEREDAALIVVTSVAGLVGLIQHGVIELHAWGSTIPQILRPDRITLDLDPDPTVKWSAVMEAAQLTRTLLEEIGLVAFLKTTGGKGLHIVTPIKPTRSWDEIKPFAKALADHLAQVLPERFVATQSKARRKNRIFVDYLRNGREATAVAAWSARARPGAPVSVPLAWDELDGRHDLREDHFNIRNAPARFEAGVDPWRDFTRRRRTVTARMLKMLEVPDPRERR